MDSGRLLDALGDLAGNENARQEYASDPDAFIGVHGHPGLPADLVNEAVSHYADVADPALAEHIAPTVMAHRGFGDTNTTGGSGLDLLATAPTVDGGDPMADLDGDPAAGSSDPITAHSGRNDAVEGEPWSEPGSGPDASPDLAFGLGAQASVGEEHDHGLDTDPVGVAVIVTAPLADIGGAGQSVHELARVDGAQQPDEPWLGDEFDGDSV